jgi:UDP-N-acetylmuramyl tripeptide synthase
VPRLTPRAGLAVTAERLASSASRRLGRGSGEMIGGKVALRVDPAVLARLAAGVASACVSATNGKTTTTRMLAAALRTTGGEVASNAGGANMTPGIVAALSSNRRATLAALEVDEIYLPAVARAVRPRAVLLLNVSRDQLDRSNETRRIAGMWRALGQELGAGTTAVANADDPLVVHAACGFADQLWVGAGQSWTSDAMVCPGCAQLLRRQPRDDGTVHWECPGCGLARPHTRIDVLGPDRLRWDGEEISLDLGLPGRVNAANAAVAAAAAGLFGAGRAAALAAVASVADVAGRYRTVELAPGVHGRLLLAKNPAGWLEMIELLALAPPRPCLIHFHARTADGRDPSWLWDVPLERLHGRPVHVSGERREDVATRLRYAGVPYTLHESLAAAAAAVGPGEVDVLATYTAFRDVLLATGALVGGAS